LGSFKADVGVLGGLILPQPFAMALGLSIDTGVWDSSVANPLKDDRGLSISNYAT
jgi:hypothetical protein